MLVYLIECVIEENAEMPGDRQVDRTTPQDRASGRRVSALAQRNARSRATGLIPGHTLT